MYLKETPICQSLFFNKVAGLRPEVCNFIKKETLTQAFSCEFCEISKKNYFYRTLPAAAPEFRRLPQSEKRNRLS